MIMPRPRSRDGIVAASGTPSTSVLSEGSFCRSVMRSEMLFFSSGESLPCNDCVASTRCMPSERPLAATFTSSRRKSGEVSSTRANSSNTMTSRGSRPPAFQ